MARYLVGEVNGQLYWHTIDEDATIAYQNETGCEPNLCKTLAGFVFGSQPYPEIPADTNLPVYPEP